MNLAGSSTRVTHAAHGLSAAGVGEPSLRIAMACALIVGGALLATDRRQGTGT